MAPRLSRRAVWYIQRLLHHMEQALREMEGTGRTLPFLVNEWRESVAHLLEGGPPTPMNLLEEQEEQAVRAWVQTLLDEIQGLLGRLGARQLLHLRPGEELVQWANREARPWERLQALQAAMGDPTPAPTGGTQFGGATGSGEPALVPAAGATLDPAHLLPPALPPGAQLGLPSLPAPPAHTAAQPLPS